MNINIIFFYQIKYISYVIHLFISSNIYNRIISYLQFFYFLKKLKFFNWCSVKSFIKIMLIFYTIWNFYLFSNINLFLHLTTV